MAGELTVVMLNWMRPENVRRFVHFYAMHDAVAQVLVGDNNPHAGPRPHSLNLANHLPPDAAEKIVVASFSQDVGLPSRFALAAMARTDHVLICDDDIDLPDDTVRRLLAEFQRNNAGAVGLHGRKPAEDGRYTIDNHYGPVPILLTRAVVTTPRVAGEALWQSVRMARALGGVPFGNGEDIVMSYVAMRQAGRPNIAVRLPYKNVGFNDANAISVRYPKHEEHRSKVVQWCREHVL